MIIKEKLVEAIIKVVPANEYSHTVKLCFKSGTHTKRCKSLDEAFEFITSNSELILPTWEDVTDNGKYGCD